MSKDNIVSESQDTVNSPKDDRNDDNNKVQVLGIDANMLQQIADDSKLNSQQLMCALLEACGARPKEIANRMRRSDQYVYQLRQQNNDYKHVVLQLQSIVAQKVVNNVSNIDELFNLQIGPSAATLIEIRDNLYAKDTDRLKASLAFLDRASKAPKQTSNVDSRAISINIDAEAFKEMQRALNDDLED